jgi:hypothetical protein
MRFTLPNPLTKLFGECKIAPPPTDDETLIAIAMSLGVSPSSVLSWKDTERGTFAVLLRGRNFDRIQETRLFNQGHL